MRYPAIQIEMPGWVEALVVQGPDCYATLDDRMGLAIELARRNIGQGGGPFGAAVFESETGRLVAPGVNRVLAENCSILHAEMMAILFAQRALGDFDLGAPDMPPCQLITSTEPCAMCLGAIPWSGVRSVVCGARDEDARRAGFDEGAKPRGWRAELAGRGIEVVEDVRRAEAAAVLEDYRKSGGIIYNARTGAPPA